MMKRPRIGIVVQRYGLEVNGGAEMAARQVAEHLKELADVTVMTTCAQDYTTWANEYSPGKTTVHGVEVHRYQVELSRRWRESQLETGRFLLGSHSITEEMNWIKRQGPFSPDLLRHLYHKAHQYDVIFFFTYLYATTMFGLPLVADKAVLVPTAHDEPFLYLDAYRVLFHLPRFLLFLTEPERELVTAVTGADSIPAKVVGIGVDPPPQPPSPVRFRQKSKINAPFLLYGGRISEAKNVPELVGNFLAFRRLHPAPLKLALMGRPHIPLPEHPDIIQLGFLTEPEKWDALSAAELIVMPSKFESLSIIILEAWLAGKPVLVNGRCQVLRYQVQQSNGGLYYTNLEEFSAALSLLLETPRLGQMLGENGRRYVQKQYNWRVVRQHYQSILQTLKPAV